MYHPAKIVKIYLPSDPNIISSDNSAQATAVMWDKNLLTLELDAKIASQASIGDVALVDYSPLSDNSPVPRHRIVKLLKGELAEDVWAEYANYLETRQKNKRPGMPIPPSDTPRYFR